MKNTFNDLLSMEFVPLSEAKARLSEQMRLMASKGKRIAITCNGKPSAVLMSYEDYLDLLRLSSEKAPNIEEKIYDFQDWKKGKARRLQVKKSILGLFDGEKLSRKGQKKYKQDEVNEFD